MTVLISILIILCCIVLILAVLVQNPKGGGLASGFTGGSQVMGVRRTADFLEKATWTLAILLFVFSIFAASYTKKGVSASTDEASSTKSKAADFGKEKPSAPAMTFPQPGAPGAVPPAGGAPAPTGK